MQLKPGEGIVLYTDGFTEAERSHWEAIWSRALMQNYQSELDQTH
ncbi:MAG: SpoIIE family protein phosphatase [Acidobacteria bacterium]|nr:SpoIIE family protein phosphatase [Acidobacteriota bacterium]